jgi:hypothetical protein
MKTTSMKIIAYLFLIFLILATSHPVDLEKEQYDKNQDKIQMSERLDRLDRKLDGILHHLNIYNIG